MLSAVQWRDKVRSEMFSHFKRDGALDSYLMLYRIDLSKEQGYAAYGIFIGNVGSYSISGLIQASIEQYNPDAYIIVGEAHAILTHDPEQAKRDIAEAGDIRKAKGVRRVVSFIFESHIQTVSEIYDVIRIDEDTAVMSEKPHKLILDGHGDYIRHLNKGEFALSIN